MDHPLRCTCGKLRGYVSRPEKGNRGLCYCRDCQAYAHFLGRPGEILDEMGGTEVIATLPRYVRFTEGVENLACMSHSERGLLRWYASCCNTPIGNTPRDYKVSYVGLVTTCLKASGKNLGGAFGPVRMRVNRHTAKGTPKPLWASLAVAIARFTVSLIRARVSGAYKYTPFFAPDRGTPVVTPRVLTRDERERVRNAV